MENWKKYVLEARAQEPPVSWNTIAIDLGEEFPELTIEQVKQKARDFYRQRPEYKGKPLYVKKEKPKPVKVAQNLEPEEVADDNWYAGQTVRFAIVSDTHINSKYTQISYLHLFYMLCKERGIKHVYHAGDISDGENMRAGHNYELYKISVDEQVEEICRVYPKIPGITTHFICGNHDASSLKHCGVDIGNMIAAKRPDMEYLGRDTAIVHLTPRCTMQLCHNWDGGSYALSYRPQKIIEAMEGGSKPNILVLGHYHKSLCMEYRNVFTIMAGCFQSQTPFQRGKALSKQSGGWIVTVDVDNDGSIRRIVPEFIPYYVDIKDDYKAWA